MQLLRVPGPDRGSGPGLLPLRSEGSKALWLVGPGGPSSHRPAGSGEEILREEEEQEGERRKKRRKKKGGGRGEEEEEALTGDQ